MTRNVAACVAAAGLPKIWKPWIPSVESESAQSPSAIDHQPRGADYDAAKGGQRNLTRTMALETAKLGITVNAIAPGMILTPMNERALKDAAYRQSLERNIPLGRAGKPDEVAGVAVFLASPAGAYITGTTITIDGGLSLELGQGA